MMPTGVASVKAFQSLVGCLLWIARCIRPNICFAVHRANRQTHKPMIRDKKMAERVARYLKEIRKLKLCINSTQGMIDATKIESCKDADFAADESDRNLLSGSMLTMDGAIGS